MFKISKCYFKYTINYFITILFILLIEWKKLKGQHYRSGYRIFSADKMEYYAVNKNYSSAAY